tara:strand:- start:302 stop:1312 length:1011 start_codon:yes stop_codon:yes gene_type:complete
MTSESIIAIDAMSGDLGAEVVVHAVRKCLDKESDLHIILVGKEKELSSLVAQIIGKESRIEIKNATEIVNMSELPTEALRRKKNSSMRVAIDLLKMGNAHACVSAGNTGALMATAKFVLKMLPEIDRPAIIAGLPAIGGTIHMLDLGANTISNEEQLFQFALMGSIVATDISNILRPRIALLNIGVEDTKGHDTVKAAANLLSSSSLNYVGFIEGSKILSGKADVIVTDGFTGNIALKTMEGTAKHFIKFLNTSINRDWFSKFQGIFVKPILKRLSLEMDSRHYNGASLVGLNGIVIKSHGDADSYAFQRAIETALVEVKNQMPQQIKKLLEQEKI